MSINKIRSTPRAKAAIAAMVIAAGTSGMVALFPDQQSLPDDAALAVKTLVVPWEGDAL